MFDEVKFDGIYRDGRNITEMVDEELQERGYDTGSVIGGVILTSINDDLTLTGTVLESENPSPHTSYELSVGVDDLETDDVEAYLNEFYDSDEHDRVTFWGTRGRRSMHQIEKWSDDEGDPLGFYVMFDSDPVDHTPETGLIHTNISAIQDSGNARENLEEVLNTVNSALGHVDRPELSAQNMDDYWSNVFQTGPQRSIRKAVSGLQTGEMNEKIDELPDIEFEDPEEVMPTVPELVSIYDELESRGWQADIGNSFDFNATAHTLKAHGFTEEEFEQQLEWIENRLDVPGDTEFQIRIYTEQEPEN